MFLRQLLSVVILPFTMTVLIPAWLMPDRQATSYSDIPGSSWDVARGFAGIAVVLLGLVLFVMSLRRFVTDGKGTLAPWDPPTKFVVTGPYRYVRNPMISGVILILFGEAAWLGERSLLMWALTFFVINAIYIPLLEEPDLRARFGEAYVEYCRHVRRLIPRLTPWTPTEH